MTNKNDFARIMAYITAGTQKQLPDASLEVYYDLLGDLPPEALMLAAKRSVLEHKYATFPPVALLREMATDSIRGEVRRMSAADAWAIAMRAMNRCDVDVVGSRERSFKDVPPLVMQAIDAFGFMAMYNMPSSAIETARAQFRGIFESLDDRERKVGLLPAPLQKALVSIGHEQEAKLADVKSVAALIGAE